MVRDPGSLSSPLGDPLTAEDVSHFLRDHPDFLAQRPELMAQLTPPASDLGRGVVDIQQFMVKRLQGEVGRLQDQQRELITTTRANLNNQNRVHAAVLFLLDSTSFEHLIQTITTDLAVLLDLDLVALAVESPSGELPSGNPSGVMVWPTGSISQLLGRRDCLLRGSIQGLESIYGPAAQLVRSEALVRLHFSSEAPDGLLAFGSREPDMFHAGQGTELLTFLSRVIERCIRSWLDMPR
jgi:uncharacterized protein